MLIAECLCLCIVHCGCDLTCQDLLGLVKLLLRFFFLEKKKCACVGKARDELTRQTETLNIK